MHAEPVEVRPAVPGDAAGVARVHVDAWRETYTALLPPGANKSFDYRMDAIPDVGEHNAAIIAELGLKR